MKLKKKVNVTDFVARARKGGEAAITPADVAAFHYRPGAGRAFRSEVVDLLLPQFGVTDLPVLRALLREEVSARREHDGCGRVLLGLAMMLSAVGSPEDVLLVHHAKFANMDAGSVIDSGLLRMAPQDELADAVRHRLASEPKASSRPLERVLSDLTAAFSTGETHEAALKSVRHALETAFAEDTLDEEDEDEDEDEG